MIGCMKEQRHTFSYEVWKLSQNEQKVLLNALVHIQWEVAMSKRQLTLLRKLKKGYGITHTKSHKGQRGYSLVI